MALTGLPLIGLAALATLAVLAATVVVWSRGGRLRFGLRPLGVLLTEALLLATVGLAVNRSEGFYPSWSALLQSSTAGGRTYPSRAGRLDHWLRTGPDARSGQALTFAWQPGGWRAWHLAGAPTVVTPAGYLQHPGWRYPVVLADDDGTWSPTAEAEAARDAGATAGPAVIVFTRSTAATTAGTLAAALPIALERDLRVTAHRWALVAARADATLAQLAVLQAPERYPAVAIVQNTVATRPAQSGATTGGGHLSAALPLPVHRGSVTATPAATVQPGLPPGINEVVVTDKVFTAPSHVPAPRGRSPAPALPAAASVVDGLRTALLWACEQTPPPLAASAPQVRYVPIHHPPKYRHHRGRSAVPRYGAPATSAAPAGGTHGAGQHRR